MFTIFDNLLASIHRVQHLVQTIEEAKTVSEMKLEARKIRHAIGELEEKLISDQSAVVSLIRQNDEMEREFLRLTDWKEEQRKYTLHKFPAGSCVYRPTHNVVSDLYLCANCFARGIKSILQPFEKVLECNTCNSSIQVEAPQKDTFYIPD